METLTIDSQTTDAISITSTTPAVAAAIYSQRDKLLDLIRAELRDRGHHSVGVTSIIVRVNTRS